MKKMFLIFFSYSIYAFTPFTGEDADPLGILNQQLELQISQFTYFDKSLNKNLNLQYSVGIQENMDIAFFYPYLWYQFHIPYDIISFQIVPFEIKILSPEEYLNLKLENEIKKYPILWYFFKETSLEYYLNEFLNPYLEKYIPKHKHNIEGFGNAGFYIKHILIQSNNLSMGYKFQLNINTSMNYQGNRRMDYNFSLIFQKMIKNFIVNLNLVYFQSSQIGENFRDTYALLLGIYYNLSPTFLIGGEYKNAIVENKKINSHDEHFLLGIVYYVKNNISINLGLHKTLIKHSSFTDWGTIVATNYGF